ncbi:MAG: NAD(P)H-dependent oxidoreductase subunit E [Chloroflexota bacterium]
MEELGGISRLGSANIGAVTQPSSADHKPPDLEKRLNAIFSRYYGEKGELLSLLQAVQDEFGFLPPEAMLAVARFIHVPEGKVYGVATFYNQFRFTPPGKHPIRVCMGTACHMAGGQLVLEAAERTLDIKVGGLTPDGEFSLERVACVGCCAIAPVMVVGETVQPKMTSFKVEEVFAARKAAAGQVPKQE